MKFSCSTAPDVKCCKNPFKLLLHILCFWGLCQQAVAQSPFVNNTLFTRREGLSEAMGNVVLEDSDGFLWIGASYGLNRFDGSGFIHLKAGEGAGQLRGQRIKYLLNWDSLHILVGTDIGVSRIHIRTLQAESVVFEAPPDMMTKANEVHQFLRSRRGGFWVVTTAAVYRLSDDLRVLHSWFFPKEQTDNAGRLESSRIWEMPDGTVWVNGPRIFKGYQVEPKVIFEIDPVRNTMQPLANPPFGDQKRFLSLRQLNDTLGFVIYENLKGQPVIGLFNLNIRQFRPTPCRPFQFWNYIPFLSEPEPGKIGMSTLAADNGHLDGPTDYFLFDWRTERWEYWPVRPSYMLKDVVKTRAGLYFAASEHGLVRGSAVNTLFESIPCIDALTEPFLTNGFKVNSTMRAGGKLFIISDSHGLFVYDEKTGNCRLMPLRHPINGDPGLKALFAMGGDTLLVSGEGLYGLDMASGKTWPLEGTGKPAVLDSFSIVVFRDSRGQFWMSNRYLNGLLHYDPVKRVFRKYVFSDIPVPNNLDRADALAEDQEGNIWMGNVFGGGLLCWVRALDRFRVYHPDRNDPNSFRDNISSLLCDGKGRIWLGTEGYGVFYFHPKDMRFQQVNTANGLPNDYVQSLALDGAGQIWVGSAAGLCRLDPETGVCRQFFKSHGLPNERIREISTVPGDSHRIFIGTDNGYRFARVDSFPDPTDEKIMINAFKINGNAYHLEDGKKLSLQAEENNLEIDFSHVNLLDGHLDRYEYRFANQPGSQWASLGNESLLRLMGLGPGDYDVHIRVCTNGGHCFEQRLLQFRIGQRFTKTPLFFTLIGLLFAAPLFIYGRFRFRLRLAALEQDRERERLRNRIAQDIHDEVGGRLTKISLAAQVAARLPDLDAAELHRRLAQLGADARVAAAGLREIIFAINPDYDRSSEMQAYFRETAREFWRGTDVAVHFDFSESPVPDLAVPPDIKRQLLLLFKEALNNAAKHSEATEVTVTFQISSDRHFVLQVRDNGNGFDPAHINNHSQGLSGMRKRAEQIGAVLQITSIPGEGTTVRVEGRM